MTSGQPTPQEVGRGSTLDEIEDLLLGGPRTLTILEVAARADVAVEEVERFWRAMGLPAVGRDELAFTPSDVVVVSSILHAGTELEVSTATGDSLVRAIGHTTERLVTWQVEAIVEHLAGRYALDDVSARLMLLARLPAIAPLLELQLVHAWRRQMAAIAARFDAEFGEAGAVPAPDGLPLARAVGFADIVSFTSRTAALGTPALAAFVQDFEARARDVVSWAGGRVVKTIGDAVLFVADDPGTGAAVALGLAEEFGGGSTVQVRVGLVWGRVLSRFGDVFGPSVNLAARLTALAPPGGVLLDPATAEHLAGREGLALEGLEPRDVAGLGVLAPVRLTRA